MICPNCGLRTVTCPDHEHLTSLHGGVTSCVECGKRMCCNGCGMAVAEDGSGVVMLTGETRKYVEPAV